MVGQRSFAPQVLFDAARQFGDRESGLWCSQLKDYGTGPDREWGSRIYRTVYTPGSDEDFKNGLKILFSHMREEIFYDAKEDSEEPLDDFPNQQLWLRMRLEVIEDCFTFDRASPKAIQQHFQAWIDEQGYYLPNSKSPNPTLEMAYSASHRFCIIVDDVTLQNLLRFPRRAVAVFDPEDHMGVKVLDVECNADSVEYPAPFDGGWLWAAPRELPMI